MVDKGQGELGRIVLSPTCIREGTSVKVVGFTFSYRPLKEITLEGVARNNE